MFWYICFWIKIKITFGFNLLKQIKEYTAGRESSLEWEGSKGRKEGLESDKPALFWLYVPLSQIPRAAPKWVSLPLRSVFHWAHLGNQLKTSFFFCFVLGLHLALHSGITPSSAWETGLLNPVDCRPSKNLTIMLMIWPLEAKLSLTPTKLPEPTE